jgi:gliding motility-associated-like protein
VIAPVNVTVNTNPVISITVTQPSVCNAVDGSILVSGTGTGVVSWSGNATGASGSVALNYSIPSLGAGNYTVVFVDAASGCQSNSVSGSLNNPGAPVLNDVLDQLVCDSYTLPPITGSGLSGNQSYWTGTGASGTQYFPGDVITSTQTIYVYDANGSCSDEENGLIIINNTPVISALPDQTACGSYTLPSISGTNLTSLAAYYSGSLASGAYYSPGDVITASATFYIYDQAASCFDQDTFSVQILPLPDVTSIGGGNTYCQGDVVDPIEVFATGVPSWTVNYTVDGMAQTATGSANPISLGSAAGVYVVTGISDANCSNTAAGTQTILINPIPPAPNAGIDSTYCSVWEIIPIFVSGQGGTFTWYDESGIVIGSGPTYLPSNISGITTYFVTQTVAGCEGAASSVIIEVTDCEIALPTAFTPNGDGSNDDWEIVDLDLIYPDNVIRIYSRWGNLLFKHDSSADGPYDQHRWDGTFEGSAMPVGSYYFIIETGLENEEAITGTVSIIKN